MGVYPNLHITYVPDYTHIEQIPIMPRGLPILVLVKSKNPMTKDHMHLLISTVGLGLKGRRVRYAMLGNGG